MMKKPISVNFYMGPSIICKWPKGAKFIGSGFFNIPGPHGDDPRPKLQITLCFQADEEAADVYRVVSCIPTGMQAPPNSRHIATVCPQPNMQFHVYELLNAAISDEFIKQIEAAESAAEEDRVRQQQLDTLQAKGIVLAGNGIVH
jgi:hypothetical protein